MLARPSEATETSRELSSQIGFRLAGSGSEEGAIHRTVLARASQPLPRRLS